MSPQNLRQRAAGGQQVAQVDEQQEQQLRSVGALVERMTPQLERVLPAHLPADRFARLVLTVLRKTPELAYCTQESLLGALMSASELGLEVGSSAEAYLVPYKGEATLIVSYKGYAKLFWQSPLAQHLDAQAVFERDDFDYGYGTAPFLRHKPARGDRGAVIYYYATAGLSTGGTAFVVLTPEEVKEIRGGKVGPQGKIADPQRWMERKTALRQLFKMLPKSTSLTLALQADESVRRDIAVPLPDAPLTYALPPGPDQQPPPGVNVATGELHDQGPAEHDDVPPPDGWDR